ncbi:ribonuclease Z [Formosa sediminum]|uniref:Ribonuclease Z n=1 Tax=Formosa sediminum TaxID=2594004 RepID=A0A516GTG8_9FLAO|nr:ribonuclease Z [Formosa sediminum]QDO94811.1 ribonuclease Z [Formosa sediminum]
MILNTESNITIVTAENETPTQLIKKMEDLYSKFKNNNVIVNLMSLNKLTLEQIIEFLQISNTHRKAKHSFVLVSDKTDLDQSIEEIVIVPTLQEAYDIIEMEEMERDLGF